MVAEISDISRVSSEVVHLPILTVIYRQSFEQPLESGWLAKLTRDLTNDGCAEIMCPECMGAGKFQLPDDWQPCNECKTAGIIWVNLW